MKKSEKFKNENTNNNNNNRYIINKICWSNQSIAVKKELSPQIIGEQITKNELKHILILASDSLGGREVGK